MFLQFSLQQLTGDAGPWPMWQQVQVCHWHRESGTTLTPAPSSTSFTGAALPWEAQRGIWHTRENPAIGGQLEPAGLEVCCGSALILGVASNLGICHAPHHSDLCRAHPFLPKHWSHGNYWRANEFLVNRECHGCVTLLTAADIGFLSLSQPLMPWVCRIITTVSFPDASMNLSTDSYSKSCCAMCRKW